MVVEVGSAGIPQAVWIGRHHTAEPVGIGLLDTGAMKGDPGGDAVRAALRAGGFEDVVAAPQRDGAAKRLEIVAAAAAGTGVYAQSGPAPQEFVPEGKITRDVPDLGDALTVGGVRVAPMGQRIHVEILPVEIDALAGQKGIGMVHKPPPRVGVAEIEEFLSAVFAEQPLRMGVVEPRAGSHPFGLEPQDGLEAPRVRVIRDGPQSPGEAVRVDLPRAGVGPP